MSKHFVSPLLGCCSLCEIQSPYRSNVMGQFSIAAHFVLFISSASIAASPETKALLILQKYGYLNVPARRSLSGATLVSDDTLKEAIAEFQRFAGLKQTGKLDKETLAKMNEPRCGDKDIIGPSTSARRKRYALQGSQWEKTLLTYRISKYSNRLKNQEKTKTEIARAFQVWSEVTPLNFEEKKRGQVDINIRFEEKEHGDGDPFDGPDNTLAHAFFPEYGGAVHFDEEEKWTVNKKSGTNLFQIATHEVGHSLGLAHSDNKNALMNPYPPWKYDPSFKLDEDDIRAIQKLYGLRKKKPKQKTQNVKEPPNQKNEIYDAPDLCVDASIDTVTRTKDGNSYVFKGIYYWKLDNDEIADGYPRRISDDWDGMPGNLDASLTKSNGKTFFFKNGKYWRFTNMDMDPGYPKLLSEKFKGIPEKLDAALDWNGNDKIYFFKGNKYWRYDNADPPVSKQFPELIKNWKGLPSRIDAAFTWENGHTYFFSDDKYYRFDDQTFEVASGDPPFPRFTSIWWFGC